MARRNSGPRLKAVKDQVIVITGASSGIGLATARMAASRGASVVLASRNETDLQKAAEEIRSKGGRAVSVVADVSKEEDVDRIGETALREFGGIDTWVNNAGLSIYGKLTEIPMADKRRLFDVNFWGIVNGCRTAVRFMKHRGGALINLGSEVSDRAIPLQGIYSASKHAVKGYTDALRMELEHDRIPISVTLVKPSAINTPYPEHARSYLEDGVPALPPPMYQPEVVAKAILTCAEKPVRDIIVGGAGRAQVLMGAIAPRLTDKLMEGPMWKQQKRYDRAHAREGNLEHPQRDGRAHGSGQGRIMSSSAYTNAVLSDVTRLIPVLAGAIAIAASYRRWRPQSY
ncbi:MAG TPA: SDR family oxidoreductase [Vicinamibacterales bacterium]|jgi:short-subunit dehydrogenase|nr:SDR family oxidoreductase [Vicinamibacterales bacterium]